MRFAKASTPKPSLSNDPSLETPSTPPVKLYEYFHILDNDISFPERCERLITRRAYQEFYIKLQNEIVIQQQIRRQVFSVVQGKAGIGKSMFVVWLMCKLLCEEENPVIFYCPRYDSKWLIRKHHPPKQCPAGHYQDCDYYLCDNVDAKQGSEYRCRLTLAASSDPNNIVEIDKRGKDNNSLVELFMPDFPYDECYNLFVHSKFLTEGW